MVETIQSFTAEKQGYVPKIVLISPPEIGEGITASPFYGRFLENAVSRSREFSKYYKTVADKYKCIFFNAAEFIKASDVDSLHLDPDAHRMTPIMIAIYFMYVQTMQMIGRVVKSILLETIICGSIFMCGTIIQAKI